MTWWMRLVVRLYPHSWRDRYEAELAALLEDSGWRVVMDVVRGRDCAARLAPDRPGRAVHESREGLERQPLFLRTTSCMSSRVNSAAGIAARPLTF